MFNVKKILVPTDFSENALTAYEPAQDLASRYGAKVDFIHFIPSFHYFNESMADLGAPLSMSKDLYPKIKKQASDHIQVLMDKYLESENKGEGIVNIVLKPSKAIAEYAKENDYDLIFMAANGQHESDFLRGSITKKVIRYSEVPVLSTDVSNLDSVQNIVVPIDGSESSFKVLPQAISVALAYNATITLYHVMELHGTLIESVGANIHESDAEGVLNSALEETLKQLWENIELRKGDPENQLIYYEGASNAAINIDIKAQKAFSAHRAITDYASEHADMVMMTTQGHSGLAHFFLGSTTEQVAQHLELPVLTVKPNLEEESEEA